MKNAYKDRDAYTKYVANPEMAQGAQKWEQPKITRYIKERSTRFTCYLGGAPMHFPMDWAFPSLVAWVAPRSILHWTGPFPPRICWLARELTSPEMAQGAQKWEQLSMKA